MPAETFGLARLDRLRDPVRQVIQPLDAPHPAYVLFVSISDGDRRASVATVGADSFDAAWQKALSAAGDLLDSQRLDGRLLRIDWPVRIEKITVKTLHKQLGRTKRNYFRLGLSLNDQFETAFLDNELNANAMLYGGNKVEHCVLNERNFALYAKTRFGNAFETDFAEARALWAFTTSGFFLDEEGRHYRLCGEGAGSGQREGQPLDRAMLDRLIDSSSSYLASQVKPDGAFVYGYHPCFDREIRTYNVLRHASTTYAMIEAYEVTRDSKTRAAIERSLGHLTGHLTRIARLPDGAEAAFLIDVGSEIKLGGNAVFLLALAKYTSVMSDDRYLPLMDKLATGIVHMQDAKTGEFRHVLLYPDLSTKAEFRTVYYDGEAAFALMRLYALTHDIRWLGAVEKAFEHFLRRNYTQYHDHWLGYCANELTLFRPEERYFRFCVENVSTYLDFVANRITTFPTLLELMMATRQALSRIADHPDLVPLLGEIDLAAFEVALEKRAHYLLNGHFYPEVAMFMRNPRRIMGSFYIRHHAFRVRIDDVEHYLSGLIAYRAYLNEKEAFKSLVSRQAGAGS